VNASGDGEAQVLQFETQVGDVFEAGAAHPIRVVYDAAGEPSPYVLVRRNLEALIDRKSFYRLVDLGVHHEVEGERWFGLWSHGAFFKVIQSDALEG